MQHSRRPSTASSISSTHSNNPISKTIRSARQRLSRRGDKHSMDYTSQTATSSRSSTPPAHLDEYGRKSSTCSERSCSRIPADEVSELWRAMLELQDEYHCYHSTRMDVAVDAGQDGLDLMPSRFIIDTLNDSVVDLPEEAWEKLDRYLRPESQDQEK